MAGQAVLIVLAVREPAMRSALAAQLTLAGVDLVTAHEVDGPVLRRSVRRPAVLILDEHTVVSRPPEWLDALVAEPYWRQIVVLCDILETHGPRDARLVHLDRHHAREAIAELLPTWVAEENG
jgi:hypothetical protein